MGQYKDHVNAATHTKHVTFSTSTLYQMSTKSLWLHKLSVWLDLPNTPDFWLNKKVSAL